MIVEQFLRWIELAEPGERAEAANALARAYLYSDMDETTRSGMEAAMTVLLDDPAPDVRLGLADALASSPAAPRHVMLALAVDQVEIAALVLSRSPIFIDVELVDMAAAAAAPLQAAIASRPTLSNAVSASIAEVGGDAAVRRLLENEGATIARISFRRIVDRFGEVGGIRELLLGRHDLPTDVRQMLVRQVSSVLGNFIAERSWVADERASVVLREACDRATISLAAETESEDLGALVEHLRLTGQLTTALLLRAVCAGNVAFLETALSVLAGVPEARVSSLVRAGRISGLRAVYAKAGLPPVAFDAFTAAIDTCRKVAAEGGPHDRYRFTRHMVESVLERYADITDGEMNELATMLRRFAGDQAREAARDFARQATAA